MNINPLTPNPLNQTPLLVAADGACILIGAIIRYWRRNHPITDNQREQLLKQIEEMKKEI